MCLYSKKKEPITARKDISCYKIIKKIILNDDIVYVSPYTDINIDTNIIKGEDVQCVESITKCEPRDCYLDNEGFAVSYYNDSIMEPLLRGYKLWGYIIDKGYIHSYSKSKKPQKLIKLYNGYKNDENCEYQLFECIIPKGTKYYKGLNHHLASEKLKYIKIK